MDTIELSKIKVVHAAVVIVAVFIAVNKFTVN
ncbi:hypothetical protein HDEF_1326 [Candidatus Hamiltonella defensa 5AT (Acyrthosiphon pisum)]|uniref:Uncharacterized protein n=1 Tax=Hamiltonella defensa subsp. Acyrthosiphon pisum (strain 5AT) TaxID=572265 RepID=C4K5X6_HAMD5|nr:hypothetical protein HDEF_1326 [Candidatus Hamiltonella defensa 5AT (Acyrthosiphon pisum)]